MNVRGRGVAATFALAFGAVVAHAQTPPKPVATGGELNAYLLRCFRPPAGSEGSEITLLFSLDRNGAIRGKPRIAWSKLVGDLDTQRAFVASAIRMLEDCTPVPVTREFGLMAANKIRVWRLASRPKADPI